jgi:transcription initiation factor TFIID subunit 5
MQMSIGGPTNTDVPGLKMESTAQRHGSALVCYEGHAPSRPVWSVSIAPCGYYFAFWHFSENVNCVSFHPNCNYIMTGSDDKTVRMWDVQSGNCVRMLNWCGAGVNKVEVSPSGQFVAGADYRGIVHTWDLRNGRKLNEFKNPLDARAHTAGLSHGHPRKVSQPPIIQSMSFSPCGNAIATSSDDSNIHILWNTQGLGNHASNPEFVALRTKQGQGGVLSSLGGKASDVPFHTFATNGTGVLDLRYTKRNLLLSVGKYFKQRAGKGIVFNVSFYLSVVHVFANVVQ